jgi:hypothetical protein
MVIPNINKKFQDIKDRGILTSRRRNIGNKTRSDVSKMVADLEDVLKREEKQPAHSNKNKATDPDHELHVAPSTE